ncbi:IclR family transcriptional regulator [Puniceicoccus vermicola]|uniref:Helix-turn-helix domain-containing protein n=1 Tax=Puniceicoccus vermicola TaxID=388746 RepID=A0A7X1AZ80_9BACT|nr:helix-turn-helix domain-containing protein [Puniceicoccus vermicola]MBC2602654.1 helix-turn-helix domain-containing protein [Puniceicoccus vermicola]
MHKAVSILEYLADRNVPIPVKELSFALNIPPASCYRMVNTLLEHNWLCEEPSGGLRIAFGLAHVARTYSGLETRLREFEPTMRVFAEELQMSVKVSLREGHFATTALRAEPSSPNAITSPIGSRIHLAIGSAAAVLLAQMPDHEIKTVLDSAPKEAWARQQPDDVWKRIRDCRERGVCFELGQYHPSVYACSVPLQLTGTDWVSLTAVGWPEHFAGARQVKIAKALRQRVETHN